MAESVSGANKGAANRLAGRAYSGVEPKCSNCSGSVQAIAAKGTESAGASQRPHRGSRWIKDCSSPGAVRIRPAVAAALS